MVLECPSEGIFFNYKHEDIDWNILDEKQKDEYFYDFVVHYLPSGFIEALGKPEYNTIGYCQIKNGAAIYELSRDGKEILVAIRIRNKWRKLED